MNRVAEVGTAAPPRKEFRLPSTGTFVMSALILTFGFYILYPVVLIFVNSFNIASIVDPYQFSFQNWQAAFSQPGVMKSIGNTFLVYVAYTSISFPLAVVIAWILARTRIPYSHGLEFLFWVSFMLPSLSTTIGWTFLLDPDIGFINQAVKWLPFVEEGPFNIYSVQGIIGAHLFGNAISQKVMLLTPAFRNMDLSLEEASIVSGASNLGTMMRVTLPVMIPPMVIVFMLNVVRIFQSFETERILGTPIGFFVYSTKIFQQIRDFDPPEYGQATALASVTLILIAAIIPIQRWLLHRRQYTTVTSSYKPGLNHLGWFQPIATTLVITVVALLTVVPVLTLVGGEHHDPGWVFPAQHRMEPPPLARGAPGPVFSTRFTEHDTPKLEHRVDFSLDVFPRCLRARAYQVAYARCLGHPFLDVRLDPRYLGGAGITVVVFRNALITAHIRYHLGAHPGDVTSG